MSADRNEIEAALRHLEKQGIQADSRKLKDDMIRQWDDYRLFAREYAANSCDARARVCQFSASEDDELQTIVIEDDGLGMDRQGVTDFMTVFRSRKPHAERPVGQHGIGRLSAAAIPGLTRFAMRTSTGSEMWRLVTPALLDDVPMTLEQLAPPAPHGTRFEFTFKKQRTQRAELKRLRQVLETYVRFLPINILVHIPIDDDPRAPAKAHFVHGEWHAPGERFVRHHAFTLDGRAYEVVLGLGSARHEVYQNRVLITATRYDLLCHGLMRTFHVPHLVIRVDSQDFELPFGRHCLRNEQDVLPRLSHHLREHVLPQYFGQLVTAYEALTLRDYGVLPGEVEEMACALLRYDARDTRLWAQLPVFDTRNQGRLSLAALRAAVRRQESLYIEDEQGSEGLDYATIDVPVLCRHQPAGGLEALEALFPHGLIHLSSENAVIEAPPGVGPRPGPREKRLERNLRFAPRAVRRALRRAATRAPGAPGARRPRESLEDLQRMAGVCDEARLALVDMRLKFRVNYLVARDGKTPCTTRRFMLKNDRVVVLNLYHPDVIALVNLAERNAPLAGHFGLALTLTDDGRLLKHLTPEAREDLLVADAIAKCGLRDEADLAEPEPQDDDAGWRNFLRDAQDDRYGLF